MYDHHNRLVLLNCTSAACHTLSVNTRPLFPNPRISRSIPISRISRVQELCRDVQAITRILPTSPVLPISPAEISCPGAMSSRDVLSWRDVQSRCPVLSSSIEILCIDNLQVSIADIVLTYLFYPCLNPLYEDLKA